MKLINSSPKTQEIYSSQASEISENLKKLKEKKIYLMQTAIVDSAMLDEYVEINSLLSATDQSLNENEIELKDAFYWLSPREQEKILTLMAVPKASVEQEIEIGSCIPEMESLYLAEELFTKGVLDQSLDLVQKFLDQDIYSIDFKDGRYKGKKEIFVARAELLKDKIDEGMGDYKEIFKAQRLAQSGKVMEAKVVIDEFLKTHPEDKYGNVARELRMQIALMQIEQVRQRAKAKGLSDKVRDEEAMLQKASARGGGFGGQANQAEGGSMGAANVEEEVIYFSVLDKMAEGIKNGTYRDFEHAYKELGIKYETQAVDLMADEVTLGNPPKGYLRLARKYRRQERFAEAEAMYRSYFRDELENVVQKEFTEQQF
jgi:hypothetical protein